MQQLNRQQLNVMKLLMGFADTSNATDHVFNDSIANELAIVSGNVKDGYILTHFIYIKG